MSRDKQIEELAGFLWKCTLVPSEELCSETAKDLINAGYRKADEVAREIFEEIAKIIRNQQEVRHGEWFRYGQDYSQCSLCGKVNTNFNNNNYCPNCGAKMDGERREE